MHTGSLESMRDVYNHSYKLQVKMAKRNCYKDSFFVRIVREWNNLPRYIVEAGNLRCFKANVKTYMCISYFFSM